MIARMMSRKQQFMRAVEILAPDNRFIHQVAQRIPGEKLPVAPGGVALEFVVALQKLGQPANGVPFEVGSDRTPAASAVAPISLSHALRIKSAEYWLKLGEADQALRELEHLPKSGWNHPYAVKNRIAALGVLTGSAVMHRE